MQVLEDQEYRSPRGYSLKLTDQRAECLLSSLLRCHLGHGIAAFGPDRKKRPNERHALAQIVAALGE